ncbi:hypothetical protein P153DRAFT_357006 [Dothidotthia symphoricarpi CBS 119687]|uniref:Uncharacterized protein n=1 Tax=Dothidotthia symphoricarpi CBS 119687 TaxID=1392245 RepID=A0A6A6AEJ6_9PLEO|nr:uncharacterized protein P153DRAFT_357006 [Dothidotthia symphoricarpi CBS 119687]KAF2129428.1 hypothetical protein P153DRAFT_357006 [Dothidotthia symphoricarpi CBS 119687]
MAVPKPRSSRIPGPKASTRKALRSKWNRALFLRPPPRLPLVSDPEKTQRDEEQEALIPEFQRREFEAGALSVVLEEDEYSASEVEKEEEEEEERAPTPQKDESIGETDMERLWDDIMALLGDEIDKGPRRHMTTPTPDEVHGVQDPAQGRSDESSACSPTTQDDYMHAFDTKEIVEAAEIPVPLFATPTSAARDTLDMPPPLISQTTRRFSLMPSDSSTSEPDVTCPSIQASTCDLAEQDAFSDFSQVCMVPSIEVGVWVAMAADGRGVVVTQVREEKDEDRMSMSIAVRELRQSGSSRGEEHDLAIAFGLEAVEKPDEEVAVEEAEQQLEPTVSGAESLEVREGIEILRNEHLDTDTDSDSDTDTENNHVGKGGRVRRCLRQVRDLGTCNSNGRRLRRR